MLQGSASKRSTCLDHFHIDGEFKGANDVFRAHVRIEQAQPGF